eukprot:7323495-Prymnesium_polylepis.1
MPRKSITKTQRGAGSIYKKPGEQKAAEEQPEAAPEPAQGDEAAALAAVASLQASLDEATGSEAAVTFASDTAVAGGLSVDQVKGIVQDAVDALGLDATTRRASMKALAGDPSAALAGIESLLPAEPAAPLGADPLALALDHSAPLST